MRLMAISMTGHEHGRHHSVNAVFTDVTDPNSATGGVLVVIDYEKQLWGRPSPSTPQIQMLPIGECGAEAAHGDVFVVTDLDNPQQAENAFNMLARRTKMYIGLVYIGR